MNRILILVVFALLFGGCAARNDVITASGSQVEIRQMQSRDYDTLDKRGTLRSVVATLQDQLVLVDL